MKRRVFIKAGVLGGGLGAAGLLNTACTTLVEKTGAYPARDVAADPTGNIVTRPDARSTEGIAHLANYALAVDFMRKQPSKVNSVANGWNWELQAQVHLQHCPHGSWNFFSWHRDYLMRFEAIINAVLSQKLNVTTPFILPYWDWAKNPALPPQFMDSNSHLYMPGDPSRNSKLSAQIGNLTNSTIVNRILASTDFESFMGSADAAGQIESSPHNGVHATLGGQMGTFSSPRDPIFWLHHCNVDRLWAQWEQNTNQHWSNPTVIAQNSKIKPWLALSMEGFYDADGHPIKDGRTAEAMLDTVKLGYNYPVVSKAAYNVRAMDRKPAAANTGYRSAKLVAFNRDAIKMISQPTVADRSSFRLTFPAFENKNGSRKRVDDYLNEYLADPDAHRNLDFRLKVEKFPQITEPTGMQISLVAGSSLHLITNYNFFVPSAEDRALAEQLKAERSANSKNLTDGQHAYHGDFVPNFNIDYKLVLDNMYKGNITTYPAQTVFQVDFIDPRTGDPRSVAGLDFSHLGLKMVVIENSEN